MSGENDDFVQEDDVIVPETPGYDEHSDEDDEGDANRSLEGPPEGPALESRSSPLLTFVLCRSHRPQGGCCSLPGR